MALHEYEPTPRNGVTTLMSVGDVDGILAGSPIRSAAVVGGLAALVVLTVSGVVKKAVKYGVIASAAYYLIKR